MKLGFMLVPLFLGEGFVDTTSDAASKFSDASGNPSLFHFETISLSVVLSRLTQFPFSLLFGQGLDLFVKVVPW